MACPSTIRYTEALKKLTQEFISSLPRSPGVYRMLDAAGTVIYVGKARNLRRRLGQYRNASRARRHRKMRELVRRAERITWEPCPSELEALLLENRLIRELRPRWNVAGAFSFLYPMIGLRQAAVSPGEIELCFTTRPEAIADRGFSLHGAFRSREIAGEAFFALIRLLDYIGHRAKRRSTKEKRVYSFAFRQLPPVFFAVWEKFFRGESREALEILSLDLLENAAARRRAAKIQEELEALERFWLHEAQLLQRARNAVGASSYPIAQGERDGIFLRYRAGLGAACQTRQDVLRQQPCIGDSP